MFLRACLAASLQLSVGIHADVFVEFARRSRTATARRSRRKRNADVRSNLFTDFEDSKFSVACPGLCDCFVLSSRKRRTGTSRQCRSVDGGCSRWLAPASGQGRRFAANVHASIDIMRIQALLFVPPRIVWLQYARLTSRGRLRCRLVSRAARGCVRDAGHVVCELSQPSVNDLEHRAQMCGLRLLRQWLGATSRSPTNSAAIRLISSIPYTRSNHRFSHCRLPRYRACAHRNHGLHLQQPGHSYRRRQHQHRDNGGGRRGRCVRVCSLARTFAALVL